MSSINIRFFFLACLVLVFGIGAAQCLDQFSISTTGENVHIQPNNEREQQALLRMIKTYISSTFHTSELVQVLDDAKLLLNVSLPFEKGRRENREKIQTPEETEQEAAMLRMLQAYVSSTKRTTSEVDQLVNDIQLVFNETPIGYDDEGRNPEPIEYFADKHIKGMTNVISDPDCMSREFDVTADDYDSEEAGEVFKKCKLLVLRNVFDVELMEEFTNNFTKFINDVNTGIVSRKGRTTNGENEYWQNLDNGKWEVLLPRTLAHVELHANDEVINVLSDEDILGDEMALHSTGTIFSESKTNFQLWHIDNPYIFYETSFERSGIGGHDLPSYAVGTLTPMLLNMTYMHGPTEFCMGSSHLSGLMSKTPKVKDASLLGPYLEYKKARENDSCPPKFWRSPLLKFGDLVLFDYQLRHRAGMNLSKEVRALFYMTYSRRWFKDSSFRVEDGDDIDSLEEILSEVEKLNSVDSLEEEEEEILSEVENLDSADSLEEILSAMENLDSADENRNSSADNDDDDDDGNKHANAEEASSKVDEEDSAEEEEEDSAEEDEQSNDDDDDDDGNGYGSTITQTAEELLLSFMLRSARLAVPDDVELLTDEKKTGYEESYVKLENMRWFDSKEVIKAQSEFILEDKTNTFVVSNSDIQLEEDIAIYIDDMKVAEFKCGESTVLTAAIGQNINIRSSSDGFVYKSWPILPNTEARQLVASSYNIEVRRHN